MNCSSSSPRPIIVLGCPRSGTTVLGVFLGSAPVVSNLGEYAGYDFCHRVASSQLSPMPAKKMQDYVDELQVHAHEFPRRIAGDALWFAVSAPWNLLVAGKIAEREAAAIFVLCIRRLEGVCQSLERSYCSGRVWAGSDTRARINLWCDFYCHALELPHSRTVIVDYDLLCQSPEREISKLKKALRGLNFPVELLDQDVFLVSHAVSGTPRSTIARRAKNGKLAWRQRQTWDPNQWTIMDQTEADTHDRYGLLASKLDKLKIEILSRQNGHKVA